MKTYCRPRWIFTYLVLFLLTVIGLVLTGPMLERAWWLTLLLFVPASVMAFGTSPRRRLRDQSVLACDCPRHLEEVPVEDRPGWGKDTF